MRIKPIIRVSLVLVLALSAFVAGILVGHNLLKPGPGEVLTQVPEQTSKTDQARVAGVPAKAYSVLEQILANQGEPPPGYRGGRTFYNDGRGGGQRLPTNTSYREYDVNPYIKGQNRGAERLVIGSNGSAWYTADHYQTFVKIK